MNEPRPLTKDKRAPIHEFCGMEPEVFVYHERVVRSAVEYLIAKARSKYTPDWSNDGDEKLSVNDVLDAFPAFKKEEQ